MSVSIHRSNVRTALKPRREPYWSAPIVPGRYLGFRRIDAQRGSWVARTRNEGFDPTKGPQLYCALGALTGTFDYPEAVRAAQAWFARLDAGVVQKGRFTIEDVCRDYIKDRRRERGDKSADDAEWRFERAVFGTDFGRTEVVKLRAPAIKAWRESLITEDDEGRQMGKSGANRMMATLRAALNMSVENRQVAATAAVEWRSVKQYRGVDRRREIYLDIEQRRSLLAASGGALRDLLEAAMLTGARPGELVSAKRSAFDARTKTLKLSGKTGPRNVTLLPAALVLFERLSKSKLPAALLLNRGDGKPWTRIEWSRQIRAVAEAAAVEDDMGKKIPLPLGVCLYTLRHSFITQAISDGMTVLEVARMVGTSLAMVDKHYGHLAQSASAERLAKVQAL
jgi:integrase